MVSSSYDFGMTVIPKKNKKKLESSLCSESLLMAFLVLYANNILDPVIHYRR